MKKNKSLQIGSFVYSPTKNGESMITALFDEQVQVNGQDELITYNELGRLKINTIVLANADFHQTPNREWKHDMLTDYLLQVDDEDRYQFKYDDGQPVGDTFSYVHELQFEFGKLADHSLPIRW